MEFRLLGPLEVYEQGRHIAVGGPRQQVVLAALLLRSNQVVTIDRLVAATWQRPPQSASVNIRAYVAGLRRAFRDSGDPDNRLITRSSGYLLRVEPDELDILSFTECVDRGDAAVREATLEKAGDAGRVEKLEAAARHFAESLRLWRGRPLEGLPIGESLNTDVVRLEECRLTVTEQYMDASLATGRAEALIPELRTLVTRHPFRERYWAQLMLALYRAGRQAEALAAYGRVRSKLAEELGIDPGPDLRRLEELILRADPALNAGPIPRAGATGACAARSR
jgi:DNA-binding SARP family transcriptional activator